MGVLSGWALSDCAGEVEGCEREGAFGPLHVFVPSGANPWRSRNHLREGDEGPTERGGTVRAGTENKLLLESDQVLMKRNGN